MVSVGVIEDVRAVTDVVGTALLVEASTDRMEALAKTIGTKPEFIPRSRSDLDALVALTDPGQSRALKSAMAFHFAGDVPIYATSQVTGGAARRRTRGTRRCQTDGTTVARPSERNPR